jgi:hypothetical protein
MKIPAVAIAAAFAGGILLGQSHLLLPHIVSYPCPLMVTAAVLLLVVWGTFAAWRASGFPRPAL